ncbi:(2Fe-2S)-binding protein [Zwartia vadi]|uniref:(2Fe-2S)-binding protein n=1 Tax=Zwartia vadi TaxID=3058168 RepID=UPI0025B2BDFE|nr:(2Fe-2S)-binding protein [Zwartia vadi]MDN3987196.1 (2Fe-2S)-binding protein [Zwartia vadi]
MATIQISFKLNGKPVHVTTHSHLSALELLRSDFFLYGARESCAQGLCGCCTIVVDGQTVSGCLTLAAALDGCDVVTIESLDANGQLDPVQQAFLESGAFQCGFCTPGFILMSKELLSLNPDPSEAEIKNYLSGNLCRCAAYPEIIQAVRLAGQRIRSAQQLKQGS